MVRSLPIELLVLVPLLAITIGCSSNDSGSGGSNEWWSLWHSADALRVQATQPRFAAACATAPATGDAIELARVALAGQRDAVDSCRCAVDRRNDRNSMTKKRGD